MNEIVIEGVIGGYWADTGSAELRRQLAGMSGDLAVYINSIGGDVFEGLSMLNQLRRHQGNITVVVDGIAASIASVVAMGGDEIIMGSGAQFMIHSPWTVTIGDSAEHAKTIEALDASKESILDAYAIRVDDREQVTEWVDAETWFSAAAAVEAGFADRIEGNSQAAAIVPKSLFKHTPAALIAPDKEAAKTVEKIKKNVWKSTTMDMQTKIAKRR